MAEVAGNGRINGGVRNALERLKAMDQEDGQVVFTDAQITRIQHILVDELCLPATGERAEFIKGLEGLGARENMWHPSNQGSE